jgi:hypothetical protein
LQASVEKRLSRNFSMAAHYTWSSFIDGASDILNPSPTGEIGYPQNSFNRSADRGRSAWDRPQRVAVNGVFELPFFRQQKGALGKALGGWQVTGFLTLQSGAPFSVLDGSDPGLLLSGLALLSARTSTPTWMCLACRSSKSSPREAHDCSLVSLPRMHWEAEMCCGHHDSATPNACAARGIESWARVDRSLATRERHECVTRMALETKFLRLRTPITIGSRFGDWRVCWLGGWTHQRLSYLVMVVRAVV